MASTAKKKQNRKIQHDTEIVRKKKNKAKRHPMTWKEWVGVIVAIVAAVAGCVVILLNTPMLQYDGLDENGEMISQRISLMRKFKLWKPFEEIGGELESKEYSWLDLDDEDDNNGVPVFDDGLDLKQIREGQFSVLFLGLDELRSNTDVMMLAMFDIAGNKINILQIPRDSFVPEYTDFEAGKINSVYSMGEQGITGVQRVVDCVEDMFQIPIDRYIITSCTDIVRIVDLIGGIPIDMPYTIEYEAGKTITKGKQVLSGQKAEWMVRYRHGYNEGDIGRMKAQRIFLAAAMEKACDLGTIELMKYADTMIDEKLIGSNLSMDEISKLSDFSTAVGMDNISMFMLPGEGYDYYPKNWKYYKYYSVWTIHKEPTIELLNTYFRPYLQPVFELPNIEELVTAGNYVNTMYDDESTTFGAIEEGDTFKGK